MKTANVLLVASLLAGMATTLVAADKTAPATPNPVQPPKAVAPSGATAPANPSTQGKATSPTAQAAARVDTNAPVIVHLERRDQFITVRSGANGPAYTVTTKKGKVVWQGLTEAELKAKAPDVYNFVKTAVAKPGEAGSKSLDARLELHLKR